MEFREILESDLQELKKTLEIIKRNPVFINEEISIIEAEIKNTEKLLEVIK